MKLLTRAVAMFLLGGLITASGTALAAGRPAYTASPRHVNLTTSGCCVYTDVTFTNTSADTLYIVPDSFVVTGDGWNYGSPNFTCYPYADRPPGDQCVVSMDFGAFNGPGSYPGTFSFEYSKNNDFSTIDGRVTVRLFGRGI